VNQLAHTGKATISFYAARKLPSIYLRVKVNVKDFRYKPDVALGVPEG
jgi:hypothetical protein